MTFKTSRKATQLHLKFFFHGFSKLLEIAVLMHILKTTAVYSSITELNTSSCLFWHCPKAMGSY